MDENWKRVEFNDSFVNPVVVAKPSSYNGKHQAVVRIKNVDSTGFDIRIQEWDYLDGSHAFETVYCNGARELYLGKWSESKSR